MKKWQQKVWEAVIDRDEGLCIYCGRQGCEVHHIIFRSHFGKNEKKRGGKCWQLKNMCVICLEHKHLVHSSGDVRKLLVRALEILGNRHGYDYTGQPWAGYV